MNSNNFTCRVIGNLSDTMHFSTFSAFALPLLTSVTAAPTTEKRSYAVKETHPVPNGWEAVAPASRAHVINLQIGLTQKNQDVLEQHAVEVSNPSHARYGQYLSASEIHDLIAPSDETINLVKEWLQEHGIHAATLSPTKDWLSVSLPVEKAEELLETSYSVFRHTDGSALVRAPSWSLPEHLHEHIDVVQPTTSFFRMSKQATTIKPETGAITWHKKDGWKKPPHYVSV